MGEILMDHASRIETQHFLQVLEIELFTPNWWRYQPLVRFWLV